MDKSDSSAGVTRVVTEQIRDGEVVGAKVVTTKPNYTLTENYGADWVKLGSVKEIHTSTKWGTQIYGPDEKLISAHLETDNGNGYTTVTDYGPDWHIISRDTMRISEPNAGVTRVGTEQIRDGEVVGAKVVTTKPNYTLTENYGADWVKLGSVKEIHTSTKWGTQIYGPDEKLISAHLETDNGNGYTTVTDYGPDWHIISRDTMRISEPNAGVTRVGTEQIRDGEVVGAKVVTTKPNYTLTENYGADWVKLGSVKEIHTSTKWGTEIYGPGEKLISAHLETDNGNGYTTVTDYGPDWHIISRDTMRISEPNAGVTRVVTEQIRDGEVVGAKVVTTKPNYTLTENYGADWVKLGSVKEIHTSTKWGTEIYGPDEKLISAHLETDNGNGYTTVTDYGPDWHIISRDTMRISEPNAGVTRVGTEQIRDGEVVGAKVVTTKPNYTLTENYGADWVKLGSVKEIHTSTKWGTEIYGPGEKLISAHLETDNGNGYTTVTDYGPDWHIISRDTMRISEPNAGVTRVGTEQIRDGEVVGAKVVTTKPNYTLTENYGADWVKLGSVKEIHTSTKWGTEIYGPDEKLISAHLETDNGNGYTTVTDYGPDWHILAKMITKTELIEGGTKIYTEYQEDGADNIQWTSTRTGVSDQAATRYVGSGVDNIFSGDLGKDTMLGNAGNDQLVGMGNDDDLRGGEGQDHLDGGAGDDKLSGGEGDDALIGGTGNDTLSGNDGSDMLVGGPGRDIMRGGAAEDVFAFLSPLESGATSLSRDVINDFELSVDKIDLTAIDANGSAVGKARFQFVETMGVGFTGIAGELIWSQADNGDTNSSHTLVEADLNGDKIADFQIQLLGLMTLTSVDFIL